MELNLEPRELALPEIIVNFDCEKTADDGWAAAKWAEPHMVEEMFEIGAVIIDTKTWEVTDRFHHYVTAPGMLKLSEYIRNLTNTDQAVYEAERVPFPDVLADFVQWVPNGVPIYSYEGKGKTGPNQPRFFDRDLIEMGCRDNNLEFPFDMDQFENTKVLFREHGIELDVSGKAPLAFEGITEADLPGQVHSAIGDAENMAFAIKLLAEGYPVRPEFVYKQAS